MPQPIGMLHFIDDSGFLQFIEAAMIDTIQMLAEDGDPDKAPIRLARIHRRNGTFIDSRDTAVDLVNRYNSIVHEHGYPSDGPGEPDDSDDCSEVPR
jgi:hypothetical protein